MFRDGLVVIIGSILMGATIIIRPNKGATVRVLSSSRVNLGRRVYTLIGSQKALSEQTLFNIQI